MLSGLVSVLSWLSIYSECYFILHIQIFLFDMAKMTSGDFLILTYNFCILSS